MATAAAVYNLTIHNCMSNPRHALQNVEFPAVTQVSKCFICLFKQMATEASEYTLTIQ